MTLDIKLKQINAKKTDKYQNPYSRILIKLKIYWIIGIIQSGVSKVIPQGPVSCML